MVDLLEDGGLQIQHKQTDAQHGKIIVLIK
jgi:hypothetical protein